MKDETAGDSTFMLPSLFCMTSLQRWVKTSGAIQIARECFVSDHGTGDSPLSAEPTTLPVQALKRKAQSFVM